MNEQRATETHQLTKPNATAPTKVAGTPWAQQSLLFVTGRLAESSLRAVVSALAEQLQFRFEIAVPGTQVAALLHANLLRNRLQIADHVDRVILPGWCQGEIPLLESHFGKPFELGPKNLYDLPEFFGQGKRREVNLDHYSIDIIAEINHATQMPLSSVMAEARSMANAGANLIDVGCVPGESSSRVSEIVSELRSEGLRVSIDSFEQPEVEQAVHAGAELILSCNHSNVDWVTQYGVEVVAIPDTPRDLQSLDRLIERMQSDGATFRLDPIIEPIGMGFTHSLERYIRVRQKYPELPMMMGIGNITELTEVDSAGVNMLLAAVCEELGIQSVLTTQVINWCRTVVKEFDVARRMVHFAVTQQTIPKHIDSSLVMLRDAKVHDPSVESLKSLASALTDANFRVFAQQGTLHLMNRHGHWSGTNPFEIVAQAMAHESNEIDPEHAFYLGYELARAEIAGHLGKNYVQDEAMTWGLLGEIASSGKVDLSEGE